MELHGKPTDAYRIFFPLGIVLGAAGVSIWPLYYYGFTEGYSGRAHALVQSEGFLYAFIAGFLLTASLADEELARQADLLAAQAKFFSSNAAWDAADRAVQVWGGKGWSPLYRPARHLMDSRVCRIYEGTDEILKLKIASAVLGKEWEAFK